MQVFRTISLFRTAKRAITTPNCYFSLVPKAHINLKIESEDVHNYFNKLEEEYSSLKDRRDQQSENRLRELQPIVQLLKERVEITEVLKKLDEMLDTKDEEMKGLVLEEKQAYEKMIEKIDSGMLDAIIPKEQTDDCNSVIVEVNAGVGGAEAMLFASELFNMYCNFGHYKGWSVQVAEYQSSEKGGVRHASAIFTGDSCYRYFMHEAGVHRVQRIPATEKSGRLHTSTASVNAIPSPSEVEIVIEPKDLKMETKRASGAGGQHVNTTDSAVRLHHLPTGITVECQVDRSQFKNRQIALQKLRALLYKKKLEEFQANVDSLRKSQVQMKYRNEKIRTYNFQQDRITDHRLQGNNFHNLSSFMEGGAQLEKLIMTLDENERMIKLLDVINRSTSKETTNPV